ncbi:hypothetical protein OU997_09940 [Pseudomonas sp. SL4(2022)]|uniref:hypothetical protein n=1 Tax=Pseudomonas sp. SL4(2022) TaxID=2994661 RepID=UPI0022721EE2|nr:hypothetical protein [Pseudomonas sp. SL4(2022)]WAC46452.1 hypothetical protein OU997_09940 [Pseudomonas sp. SL4(2022)]
MNPFKKTILCSALASTLLEAHAAGLSILTVDAAFSAALPQEPWASVNASDHLNGSTSNNKITIVEGADLKTNLYGASNKTAGIDPSKALNMQNNSVTIEGGKAGSIEAATSSFNGTLSGNSITMNNGEALTLKATHVTPGHQGPSLDAPIYKESSGNTITINGGNAQQVYVSTGAANKHSDNHAIINGGSVTDVKGVLILNVNNALSISNSVTILGGLIRQNAYGSYNPQGNADGASMISNRLVASGGVIAGNAFGADSSTSNNSLIGNSATVSNTAEIGGHVNGAVIAAGNSNLAQGNSATVSGGKIGGNVHGGHVAAGNDNGVLGNNATVSNGAITGSVYGGSSFSGSGNVVSGNSAAISDGQIGGSVYGGANFSANGALVSANNTAISGGQIAGSVYGGFSFGAVSGNSVTVSDGQIAGNVYGGNSNGVAEVSGNSVSVSGGHIAGNVFGGLGASSSAVFGNSVTLGSDVSIGGIVYGGKSGAAGTVSNNSLNINGYGVTAAGVQGVEHYNFSLNPSSAEVAALSVNTAVDMTGSKVRITEGGLWRVGDRATLINKVTNASATTQLLSQGLSMQYQADIAMVNTAEPLKAPGDNALQLKITGVNLNPQTKAASEGRIAGLAMINQGTDMAVAMGQSLGAELAEGDVQGFINSGGTSSRYESGSHVDLNGASLIAGVAKRTDFGLLGGFFEAGEGSYNSVNTFSNAASVKGSGKARYTGLGLLGRYDLNQSLYLDSTLRAGRAGLNFASKTWCDEQGQCADYSSSVAYYGASLAIGYVQPITDKTSVDMRSGVEWAHQKGTTTHIGNDPYRFAATDSKRWVNGVRISHDVLDNLAAYGGVSYEYEFDGKANGSVHGMQLAAPTLKGGTTVAEVGVRATHKIDNNVLSLDVGLQGYEGQRSGFGGQLRVGFTY